jgi:glycosyltransferase involved in cell wall biosynthesis
MFLSVTLQNSDLGTQWRTSAPPPSDEELAGIVLGSDEAPASIVCSDPELVLFVPANDVRNPEVSIVIPALNESLTITDFVAWCVAGLEAAGVVGEILIVDSSTDDTAELAVAGGARVLKTPKRGLGRAYQDALPFIRGKFIVMGDADCTYDFRELKVFVDAYRNGAEFVMGSRWKGYIEPGSMPPHHQYFGTPFTTWILNRVYSSKFSDIHCGMRGLTIDAFRRMDLQSQSWEYASEMVLKSVHLGLSTTEVPVRFLKDRDGRVSHHKRMGWFSPFQAAWINMRAMFVYGSDFFVHKPGAVLLMLGALLTTFMSFGERTVGPVTLSIRWMFLASAIGFTGLVGVLLGSISKILFDYSGTKTQQILNFFRYTRTSAVAGVGFALGLLFNVPLLRVYLASSLALNSNVERQSHQAIFGLFLMVSSFFLFSFMLVIHGTAVALKRAGEK